MTERGNAQSVCGAGVERMEPREKAWGRFTVECVGADGKVKWTERFDNLITTVGKNQLLDAALAGSAYTAACYMGLISSVSYSAIALADTMSSHAGWTEAGVTNAPTYTGPRKTVAWASAASGAKSLSSTLTFAITGSGTVKGLFIVFGTGASSAIDNTGGVLYSAGLFSGGDKAVVNTDNLVVSYSTGI